MSESHKILLYFLKNLDTSLKIVLGLRNRSLTAVGRNCRQNRFPNPRNQFSQQFNRRNRSDGNPSGLSNINYVSLNNKISKIKLNYF